MNSKIPAYLIHSRVTSSRLDAAKFSLKPFTDNLTVITTFDACELSKEFVESITRETLWESRVELISPILKDNFYASSRKVDIKQGKDYVQIAKTFTDDIRNIKWLRPRKLSRGEISVILKHFTALTMIANSSANYGLIAEDDVLHNSAIPQDMIQKFLSTYPLFQADYIDLAGGCGLSASPTTNLVDDSMLKIFPGRTRTNAAYIVSRKYAEAICHLFFPIVMPIDWHLTYIMYSLLSEDFNVYWNQSDLLLHGSELGHYQSWRS